VQSICETNMNRALPTILLSLATAVVTDLACAQAFVSPLVIESRPATITVANSGTEPLRLAVTLGDFDQDGAGRSVFTAVGHSPHRGNRRFGSGRVAAHGPVE
jgi:hypothetical protein